MNYFDNDDVKRYNPKKRVQAKRQNDQDEDNRFTNSVDYPGSDEDVRRREENYLFRGYGTMLDQSETIDFSEGTDSD